jgi:hypothetical protein
MNLSFKFILFNTNTFMKSIISLLFTTTSVFAATDMDWQQDLQCGELTNPLKHTELAHSDYTRGSAESMEACADYCQS